MPDRIEWYLVELQDKLKGRLAQAQIDKTLMETESHLRESAQGLVANGASSESANRQAIAAYGFAEDIAANACSGANPVAVFKLAPGGRIAIVSVVLATLAMGCLIFLGQPQEFLGIKMVHDYRCSAQSVHRHIPTQRGGVIQRSR